MAKRKKVEWNFGDIFLIPLLDGTFNVGQVLDLRIINCVRCAIYDERCKAAQPDTNELCKQNNLLSLVECTREQLDFSVWKIVGNSKVVIPIERFPNENFRNNNWIGSKTYDAAIIEDFVNAFYALQPWDDWGDPNYLDKFLIDKSKKPTNLILTKT
jgi:hypothetical protein